MSAKRKVDQFQNFIDDFQRTIEFTDEGIGKITKKIRQSFIEMPSDVKIAYNNLNNFKSRFDSRSSNLIRNASNERNFRAIPFELQKFDSVLSGIDEMFNELSNRYRENSNFKALTKKFHQFFASFEKFEKRLLGEVKNLEKREFREERIERDRTMGKKINFQRNTKRN